MDEQEKDISIASLIGYAAVITALSVVLGLGVLLVMGGV